MLLSVLIGSLAWTGDISAINQLTSSSVNFPEIKSTDRVLIFSPHPDDESLGVGGLIKYATKRGASVLIVEITSGEEMDPSNFQQYLKKTNKKNINTNIGETRQKEALNAAKNLGLKDDSIIFLGYPDGSIKTLFEENWDYNNLLKVDNGDSRYNNSPYNSSYEPHAPYCGANLAKNIEQIIVDYKPTLIIYPDGGDYHPDHFGASAFVRFAEIQTNYTGKSYSYLVHYPNWPTPHYYSPQSNLTYPYSFATSDVKWYFRNLNRGEESSKKKAIESFPTQLIVNSTYYLSFIRTNELFTTYPDINIEKVEGLNLLEMPESSYAKTEVNMQKGSKDPTGIITESGVAYDDTNVYLLIKTSYDSNNLNFTYHIQTFNGSDSQKMDITVKNQNAILISHTNKTLKSMKVLEVKSVEDMLIVSVPLNLFSSVDQFMLSLEYTHPHDYRDSIPWRLFRFPT